MDIFIWILHESSIIWKSLQSMGRMLNEKSKALILFIMLSLIFVTGCPMQNKAKEPKTGKYVM
mgnify:CR=1 FL=1